MIIFFQDLLLIFLEDYRRYKEVTTTDMDMRFNLTTSEILKLDFKDPDVCYVFCDLINKSILRLDISIIVSLKLEKIKKNARLCTIMEYIKEVENA